MANVAGTKSTVKTLEFVLAEGDAIAGELAFADSWYLLHAFYVVLRVSETRGWNASMFLVGERNMSAHVSRDLLCQAVIAYAEEEALLHSTRKIDHGEFAFPGLAQPAFLGKFLDEAGPVSNGIVPVKRYEDPGGQQQQRPPDSSGNYDHTPPAAAPRARRRCARCPSLATLVRYRSILVSVVFHRSPGLFVTMPA